MSHTDCPTPEELSAFLRGELSEFLLERVAEHLGSCPHCDSAARVLDGVADPVIAALRHAPSTPAGLNRDGRYGANAGQRPLGSLPLCHPAEPLTNRIGDYEILERIGQGGMGVVYKARQTALNRLVALKILREGIFANPEELARFRNEAMALARLRHPHIVQIHDIGEHEGQPFFSLEYADAGNLAQKANGRPLPSRPAAQLVELLALAIHAAHQQGVIHRDLKPANVLLVRSDPLHGVRLEDGPEEAGYFEPKITDFGLAKRLDTDRRQTGSETVMGTPSYMAPEQAAGKNREASPLTDVYALGAVLYELLTGRPPFQGETPLDTLEQVGSQDPVPPTRLQPKAPRDLETICLKCLHKEPHKRYASAAGLAEDLRRFRAGEPIRARPIRAWERAVKWARRRPAVAALVGVSLLAVVSLLLGGLWYEARLRKAFRETQGNLQLARNSLQLARKAADELALNVNQDPRLRNRDLEDFRTQLLQSAVNIYRELATQSTGHPEMEAERATIFMHFGDLRATIFMHFGDLTTQMGSKSEALDLYRRALEIFEHLHAGNPSAREYQDQLAHCHNYMGHLYRETNQPDKAWTAFQKARDLRDRLAQMDPSVAGYHEGRAGTRLNLGLLHLDTGRQDLAEAAFRETAEIGEQLVRDYPTVPGTRSILALSYNNLGTIYLGHGHYTKAENALRNAQILYEKLADSDPARLEYQERLAGTWKNFGYALRFTGHTDEAEAAYKKALAVWDQLAQKHSSVILYRYKRAETQHVLAQLYEGTRRPYEAEVMLQEASPVLEQLAAAHGSVVEYQERLADSLELLGLVYRGTGRPKKAVDVAQRALDYRDRLLREGPAAHKQHNQRLRAGTYLALGIAYTDLRQTDQAETVLRTAHTTSKELATANPLVPGHRQLVAKCAQALGKLYEASGRPDLAEAAYREAVSIWEQLAQKNPQMPTEVLNIGENHLRLGNIKRQHDQPEAALECYAQGCNVLEALLRRKPQYGNIWELLYKIVRARVEVLSKQQRYQEALAVWDRAIALAKQQPERPVLQALRLRTLAHLQDHARFTAEAKVLTEQPDLPACALYHLACAYAWSSRAALGDARLPPPDRQRVAEQHAAQAAKLWQQAVGVGLKRLLSS
jgi:tetratricopeptide (TPR) repeat protein